MSDPSEDAAVPMPDSTTGGAIVPDELIMKQQEAIEKEV